MNCLERLAMIQYFTLSSMFSSIKGGHRTVQICLRDEKTRKRVSLGIITRHQMPSFYSRTIGVCVGEPVMRKHVLLLSKQISESTQSSEKKSTLIGCYSKATLHIFVF